MGIWKKKLVTINLLSLFGFSFGWLLPFYASASECRQIFKSDLLTRIVSLERVQILAKEDPEGEVRVPQILEIAIHPSGNEISVITDTGEIFKIPFHQEVERVWSAPIFTFGPSNEKRLFQAPRVLDYGMAKELAWIWQKVENLVFPENSPEFVFNHRDGVTNHVEFRLPSAVLIPGSQLFAFVRPDFTILYRWNLSGKATNSKSRLDWKMEQIFRTDKNLVKFVQGPAGVVYAIEGDLHREPHSSRIFEIHLRSPKSDITEPVTMRELITLKSANSRWRSIAYGSHNGVLTLLSTQKFYRLKKDPQRRGFDVLLEKNLDVIFGDRGSTDVRFRPRYHMSPNYLVRFVPGRSEVKIFDSTQEETLVKRFDDPIHTIALRDIDEHHSVLAVGLGNGEVKVHRLQAD